MKRKLVAVLMAMTLALSCGVVALADEPSVDGTMTSQNGNVEVEGEEKEDVIVPDDYADTTKNGTDVSGDASKASKENVAENQNPDTDGKDVAEQELPIDEAHFPDANFREYIKNDMDLDGNGSLSQRERWHYIIVSGDVYNIKSFEGIEYLDSDFFLIGGLSLESLDLSKNTELFEVSLINSQITNLYLNSDLEGLRYTNGTQILNVDGSNLKKLKRLWCDSLIPSIMSIPTLEYIKLYNDVHLPYLDLSNHNIRLVDEEWGDNGVAGSHGPMGGAFIAPQTLSRTVKSVNGVWTLDMASIVGKGYLDRVMLATEGAKMSKDGLVTFQGSEVPKQLVYKFDTKTPAETTLMEVTVNLSGVNDQTKEEVSVDTSGMDIDSICKDNNVNPDDVEIVVSQETPSKEDADKLAGEATSKGLKVAATYEILLKLFSQGNEIGEITENFGNVTLTLQAGKDYAGYKAVVFQLHNGQVIEHNGLTVNADGTVTITVDKFSTLAVAVGEKSDSTIDKPATTPSTTNPSTDGIKPVSTEGNNKTTNAGNVNTGDGNNIVVWMMLSVIALCVCGFCGRKKLCRS